MPNFSRPADSEYAPEFAPYVQLVTGEDPLKFLKKQGIVILNLLRSLDDETAERRYQPGKWSVKELVGHLIDMERLFAFRALWLARWAEMTQPSVDENRWQDNSNAGRRPLAALWREHHVARTDHLYLFKGLDEEARESEGTVAGHRLSVRAIPWIIAGHERHHLDILRERYGIG